jgi:golgi phosphoprotein 3
MNTNGNLALYEEMLLLMLRAREGTVPAAIQCQTALGGAILAQLLLSQRIEIDGDKHSHRMTLKDKRPLGDTILDECLAKVATTRRCAQAQTWVQRFAMLRNLKHRVADRLCDRGVLRADRSSVLWIFSRRVYPEVDPRPKREMVRRLERAIFTDGSEVEARTIVLLSLAKSADLLRLIFDRKALKGRKQRIESLVNGQVAGVATRDAIQAAQAAAVVAACIIPAVAATHVHAH